MTSSRQPQASAPAETILCAAAFVSPGTAEDHRGVTHVAIAGGEIVALGGDEVAAEWCDEHTAVHDFAGATVLPGLVDTHVHPVWGSLQRGSSVSLAAASSLEELRGVLSGELPTERGRWLHGHDLDLDIFAGDPSGRMLEHWFPGVPLVLMARDAHSLVVSPSLLADLGITGEQTFPDASRIAVDAAGPTGWVVELSAMDLVLDSDTSPQLPLTARARHLQAGLEELAAGGLTAIHALDFHDPSQALYEELERVGELPLKVRVFPLIPADSGIEAWEEAAALQGVGGRRWCVAGVKFMLDGTGENGTAWFSEPDSEGENHRPLWRDLAQYRAAMRFFTERGIQTVTHAIGDGAVAWVLDLVAEIGHAPGAPHRIEHIESIPDALLARFAETGVVAGMQPTHATRLMEPNGADAWTRRIGHVRRADGWRAADLLAHGATLVVSSDWPIGVGDPRIGLADAQLRRAVDAPSNAPMNIGQALSVEQAYAAMTSAPAAAEGRTGRSGEIAVGAAADLVVFEANPLELSPEAQPHNRVLARYIDGFRVETKEWQ